MAKLLGAKVMNLGKIILLALLLMESDGLLSSALSVDRNLARWAYAGAMAGCFFLCIIQLIVKWRLKAKRAFYYPVVVFATILIISAGSAAYVFPKPISDWLFSLYEFLPLFIFYAFLLLKVNEHEIASSFILLALGVSALLLVDRFHHLAFLDGFTRGSVFFDDVRRVVVLKNEVIFGAVLLAAKWIGGQVPRSLRSATAVALAFLVLVQSFIMETRLGFAALAVAIVVLLYVNSWSRRVIRIAVLGACVVILVGPVIFHQHIQKLSTMSIHDDTSNISVRIEATKHYAEVYRESRGWGMGAMSATAETNNVLKRDPRYNIVDIGAFAALFQFGVPGLLLWVWLTLKCIRRFTAWFHASSKQNFVASGALAFTLGFTISVLPLSFFTQTWTISMGGVLLYLVWLSLTTSNFSKPYVSRPLCTTGSLG